MEGHQWGSSPKGGFVEQTKSRKEEEHIADIEEVIGDAKTSAAIAILQAKIKLVEDLENTRF